MTTTVLEACGSAASSPDTSTPSGDAGKGDGSLARAGTWVGTEHCGAQASQVSIDASQITVSARTVTIKGLTIGPVNGWSCADQTFIAVRRAGDSASMVGFGPLGKLPDGGPDAPLDWTPCATATAAYGPTVLSLGGGSLIDSSAGHVLGFHVAYSSGTVDADGGVIPPGPNAAPAGPLQGLCTFLLKR